MRGINVGGRTLKMELLRSIAQDCGFDDVSTFIQSGNVLFTSRKGVAKVGSELHDAVLAATGIDSRVVVRTAAQLAAVVADNPLASRTDDPTKLSVSFLFEPVVVTLDAVDPSEFAPDEVVVLGVHAFLFTPNGMGKTKLVEPLMKRLGILGTARNWRTVTKLAEFTAR